MSLSLLIIARQKRKKKCVFLFYLLHRIVGKEEVVEEEGLGVYLYIEC